MVFKKDRPYFVHDPEGSGMTYFATVQERDKFAAECVQAYLVDNEWWGECVTDVVVGVVTHSAQQTNLQTPDGEVDEEGMDEAGDYWEPDCEYRCNYELLPLDSKQQNRQR